MPNRYIREDAIESEALNAVSWQAEVFYRRLLNRVDDFGRFTANHALLRASIFPLQLEKVRDSDMPRLLAECEKAGLLFVYSADSKPWLVINKWEKGRASSSKIPSPPADICEQMRTFVYSRKHLRTSANICKHLHTDAPDSDSDSDTDADTDSDADKGAGAPVFPLLLNTEAFKAAWADYLAYRRENRMKPLKARSESAQLAELADWGEPAAIQAIRDTIRNGWQGLFAPKPGAAPAKPARTAEDQARVERVLNYQPGL